MNVQTQPFSADILVVQNGDYESLLRVRCRGPYHDSLPTLSSKFWETSDY